MRCRIGSGHNRSLIGQGNVAEGRVLSLAPSLDRDQRRVCGPGEVFSAKDLVWLDSRDEHRNNGVGSGRGSLLGASAREENVSPDACEWDRPNRPPPAFPPVPHR
ncbi:hypothetical protein CN059_20980 [Sinorhizobium medicae]|nr:hypothetical protein CN059_20980 [Sinorhizobium medicae]